MRCTGSLKGPSIDFDTGKIILPIKINEDVRKDIQKYMDVPNLDIEIKVHRERRSLDANAYFHVLVGKIAEAITISKTRCKNILIGRYGQPEILDDGNFAILKSNIPYEKMLENEFLHVVAVGCRHENGQEIIFYKVMRGSHTYNTYEMSKLIDGTVADAKELGIETMTPKELERMVKAWQNS